MARDRGEPLPPADLTTRELRLATLPLGPWSRIHRSTLEPCFFSEDTSNRFSSAGLGVLYVADGPVTAFWETFWDDLGTRPPDERRISRRKLNQRVIRDALLRRPLRVFDATDSDSLKAVSATIGTFSGSYAICQAWARALHDHPSNPAGIRYPSARHGGGLCLALFASHITCDDFSFEPATVISEFNPILHAMLSDRIDMLDE